MAEQLTEEEQESLRAKYQDHFNLLDTDKDGELTQGELGVLLRLEGQIPTSDEVNEWYTEACKDGPLTIDVFCTMMEKLKTIDPKVELRLAFEVFDQNKDGKIDLEELKTVMAHFGMNGDDLEEMTEMMTVADSNRDGHVDYEEFVTLMTD